MLEREHILSANWIKMNSSFKVCVKPGFSCQQIEDYVRQNWEILSPNKYLITFSRKRCTKLHHYSNYSCYMGEAEAVSFEIKRKDEPNEC